MLAFWILYIWCGRHHLRGNTVQSASCNFAWTSLHTSCSLILINVSFPCDSEKWLWSDFTSLVSAKVFISGLFCLVSVHLSNIYYTERMPENMESEKHGLQGSDPKRSPSPWGWQMWGDIVGLNCEKQSHERLWGSFGPRLGFGKGLKLYTEGNINGNKDILWTDMKEVQLLPVVNINSYVFLKTLLSILWIAIFETVWHSIFQCKVESCKIWLGCFSLVNNEWFWGRRKESGEGFRQWVMLEQCGQGRV